MFSRSTGFEKMSSKLAVIAVYGPPKSEIASYRCRDPDGEVTGLAAPTAAAARTLVSELALKLGAARMGDNDH